MISAAYAQAAEGAAQAEAFYQTPEFWVALSFILLVALIAKPAYRAITKGLDEKISEIQDRIDEAMRLREEAQDMLAKAKRSLSDAEREAENIVAEAREEAQSLRAKMSDEAEASLRRRERQAMDRIAQAEAEATAEVRAMTADIALEATRRILADEVQGERADQLIDAAIGELGEKLH